MWTVNGWRAGGGGVIEHWRDEGNIGKEFCPNFLQPLLDKEL